MTAGDISFYGSMPAAVLYRQLQPSELILKLLDSPRIEEGIREREKN